MLNYETAKVLKCSAYCRYYVLNEYVLRKQSHDQGRTNKLFVLYPYLE